MSRPKKISGSSNNRLTKEEMARLFQRAERAVRHAIAPSSQFRVGAALLTVNHKIYSGCNIESPVYLGLCAERVALFKALSEGAREFLALAIHGEEPTPLLPCGTCRQLLWEFAPTIKVIVKIQGHTHGYALTELLPRPFERNHRNHSKTQ